MVALCLMICGCGSFAQQGVAEVQGPEGGILVEYDGFTVSYNPEHRIPNWVLYELTPDETYGQTQRNGKYFRPDEALWAKQADDYDYRNSGWTRGHMAPAGDFKWSDDAMWDTSAVLRMRTSTAVNGTLWKRKSATGQGNTEV